MVNEQGVISSHLVLCRRHRGDTPPIGSSCRDDAGFCFLHGRTVWAFSGLVSSLRQRSKLTNTERRLIACHFAAKEVVEHAFDGGGGLRGFGWRHGGWNGRWLLCRRWSGGGVEPALGEG